MLQPGEGISAARTMPIGQVFFVPREEIALLECTAEELEEMRIADEEFGRAKEASQVMTPTGFPTVRTTSRRAAPGRKSRRRRKLGAGQACRSAPPASAHRKSLVPPSLSRPPQLGLSSTDNQRGMHLPGSQRPIALTRHAERSCGDLSGRFDFVALDVGVLQREPPSGTPAPHPRWSSRSDCLARHSPARRDAQAPEGASRGGLTPLHQCTTIGA